ncbi:hypothetical protein PIB30_040202 [Stylosanthes scabra]|uniref:Uncharacterized protein n=1 Tax=Stylosanthes scabra TaxID=79078 RepID=A0ABU6QE57_9FABA|nr:hypothetical protein [Stylosanthes scabra]
MGWHGRAIWVVRAHHQRKTSLLRKEGADVASGARGRAMIFRYRAPRARVPSHDLIVRLHDLKIPHLGGLYPGRALARPYRAFARVETAKPAALSSLRAVAWYPHANARFPVMLSASPLFVTFDRTSVPCGRTILPAALK